MKKMFIIMFSFLMVLTISACGGESKEEKALRSAYDENEILFIIGEQEALFGGFIERVIYGRNMWAKTHENMFGTPLEWDSQDGENYNLEIQNNVLSQMIEELYVKVALKDLGLKVTDADFQDFMDEFIEKTFDGDYERFLSELEDYGETIGQFEDSIMDYLMSEKVIDELSSSYEVSEEEMIEYYNEVYIPKVTEDDREIKDFEDVSEIIETLIRREKASDAISSYWDDLYERYEITFNEVIKLPIK